MDENFNEAFSKKLRAYMEAFQMSQKDLSKKMGVSEASVSNWVKGVKVPRADKIDRLCVIFKCNRADLIDKLTEEPVSPIVKEHISNYSQLKPEFQSLIDELIEVIQDEPPNTAKVLELIGRISILLHS